MNPTAILLQRLRNQRLIGAPFRTVRDCVRSLTAVQAQDYPAAKWGIGQRVRRCVDADVEAAYNRGVILRTHVMRPTWHFVLPEDIRWLLALTAPRVKQAIAYYDRQLELDTRTFTRAYAAISKTLLGGEHATRAELGRELAEVGITASGQRLAHIIMHAELDAIACSGAMRGKQHTYALFDERAPGATTPSRDEALAELTRRLREPRAGDHARLRVVVGAGSRRREARDRVDRRRSRMQRHRREAVLVEAIDESREAERSDGSSAAELR